MTQFLQQTLFFILFMALGLFSAQAKTQKVDASKRQGRSTSTKLNRQLVYKIEIHIDNHIRLSSISLAKAERGPASIKLKIDHLEKIASLKANNFDSILTEFYKPSPANTKSCPKDALLTTVFFDQKGKELEKRQECYNSSDENLNAKKELLKLLTSVALTQ